MSSASDGYCRCVFTVIVVVIMCGPMDFIQEFMLTAEDMHMTDPHEYVYVLAMQNAMDISRPWQQSKTKNKRNMATAFKPVLLVSKGVYCMYIL